MILTQRLLTEKGYSVGNIDGIGGKKTAAALGLYLEDQGFQGVTVTGTRHVLDAKITGIGPAEPVTVDDFDDPDDLFDAKEEAELGPVHPDLVKVVMRCKETCPVDFGVHDGIRTAAEQHALFKRGASQRDGYRRKSEHQLQDSGYGHAVDLVPIVNGRWKWDWDIIYVIAEHMQMAAEELGVPLRWGGSWTKINGLSGSPDQWVQAYVRRKQRQGKKAFNDGPHWELTT